MTLALRHDITATDTDDGMVLLDEITGRYWVLNRTGALVLRTLLDGATVHDAARGLGEKYPGPGLPPERFADDVASVVRALSAAGLVVDGA
ncbi:PqqD family protein [Streptomyces griseocarneus]|nr:PqqD family protein [Streptomyces griseocarneus]